MFVRSKRLLAYYSRLQSLYFDMLHYHLLINVVTFDPIPKVEAVGKVQIIYFHVAVCFCVRRSHRKHLIWNSDTV